MNQKTLLLGVGGLAVAGLALAFATSSSPSTPALSTDMSWQDRVIARVSGHEGSYASLNLNKDGAGLSFGMIQWAQKPGTLGKLLVHMHAVDPVRFQNTFGEAWPELLAVTAQGQLAKIQGAHLWQSPWKERFKAAGKDPVYQNVQRQVAREGEHFQGALKAAVALGVHTERALTLLYDRSVQQGPARALQLAKEAAATGLPARERLEHLAQRAAARYYSSSKPSSSSGRGTWKQAADGGWHYWVGSFDLYAGITRRSRSILDDPQISDAQVRL